MVMNDYGDDDDSDLSGSNDETRASKNQLQLGFVKTCSQTTLFIYNQSLLKINQVNFPSSSIPLEVWKNQTLWSPLQCTGVPASLETEGDEHFKKILHHGPSNLRTDVANDAPRGVFCQIYQRQDKD